MFSSTKESNATSAINGTLNDNPCVRNCCLDEQDVCLGCGRTLAEITGWTRLSKNERERVLLDASKRKKDRSIG